VQLLLKKAPRIEISELEIEEILPHRDRMLLLNRVIITEKEIVGTFNITEEVCEGHAFKGNKVFKGSDLLDMAAQLLGVWSAQYEDIFICSTIVLLCIVAIVVLV